MAGLIAILLSVGVLLNSRYPETLDLSEGVEAAGWVVSYSLAFLWLNNRIMLFGLILITIYGNLKIWLEEIIPHFQMNFDLGLIQVMLVLLYLLGIACLTMALWPQFYPKYLTKKINWSPFQAVGLVLLISVAFQFAGIMT